MKFTKTSSTALAILAALNASQAFAANKTVELDKIVVTANPLGKTNSELAQPVTILEGDELLLDIQPTIGDTLNNQPGIRSSYHGPSAGRPVIRGLGGDQILLLQNGIGNLDASNTSVDHNVAIDPLTVEKIEVIRGPAALLYGSRAVGGVVNVIDNRIPDEPIEEKLTGQTDVRYNSANDERSASAKFEGGVEDFAWHFNTFKRLTDDIDIPGFAVSGRERATGEESDRNHIENSQSNTDGFTLGLSRFFDKGYFGASFTNYESRYGVVGHDHGAGDPVTLDMEQQRIDVAGLYKADTDLIKEINYKFGYSDYEHTEFEGTETGTEFENEGYDARVEIVHQKLGGFEGAIGFQSTESDFSALGDEAFVPPSTTRNNAVFVFEEAALNDSLNLQLGGRVEHQDITVEQITGFENSNSRDDITVSGSAGLVQNLAQDYSVALSASYTERAPNAQELYANGNHVAIDIFEEGNENLDIQRSLGLDLSFRKEQGKASGELNLFYNYFEDFIALSNANRTDGGVDVYEYVNLPAEFVGAEIKALINAYTKANQKLDFEVRADYLHARNRDTNESLPRIAPARIGTSAIYEYGKFGTRLDADYNFAQHEVPEEDLPTDGFFMVDFTIDYEINVGPTASLLYVQATNLLDREARNHVSFVKDDVPLPGRSIMVGLRTQF